MTNKYEPIHYKHETVVFVPCYQKNPSINEVGSPTFTYNLAEASSDLQMVESMDPDYILVLRGEFDAMTQPYDLNIVKHNIGLKED